MRTEVKSPKYDSKNFSDIPYLDSIVIYNKENKEAVLFSVNRSDKECIETEIQFGGFKIEKIIEFSTLSGFDIKMTNGADKDIVKPSECKDIEINNDIISVKFPTLSWNMIRIKVIEN